MDLAPIRRIDETIRHDFQRVQDAHSARVAGADEEFIDEATLVARWSKGGVPVWDGQLELVARYAPDLGVYRWWWAGRPDGVASSSRIDKAFGEAQRLNIAIVSARQIVLDDAADAEMLARVVSHLARAHGLIARADPHQISFYALYESAASLERAMRTPTTRPRSVPPLDVATSGLHAYAARSIPPPAVAPKPPSQPPPAARPVSEPSIELVFPVAQAAGAAVKRALGGAFQNAVLVVVVDTSREKARFYAQLVATSPFGELEAPDTSKELFDAVTNLIVADARTNGRWHKLVVRFHPDGSGIAVGRVEVF